ncbi:MAG: hypothetical protein ACFFDN_38020, partial [Candidatus Hodarchaeota archaeon]
DNFFLVFLNTYDPLWKAYYMENGLNRTFPEDYHIKVFDYANAWYLNEKGGVAMILEYVPQQLYKLCSQISFLAFAVLLSLVIIPETQIRQTKKSASKVKKLIASYRGAT